jgi:hypothetical protein
MLEKARACQVYRLAGQQGLLAFAAHRFRRQLGRGQPVDGIAMWTNDVQGIGLGGSGHV